MTTNTYQVDGVGFIGFYDLPIVHVLAEGALDRLHVSREGVRR